MKRDILTVADFTADEINGLIDRAIELKSGGREGFKPLTGKSIGLIFEGISTRTRVSFEVAIYRLGGQSIFLTPDEIQLSRGETIADTARVLSRYLHGIVLRTFKHERAEELAKAASIPVINGLTDRHHPCQAISDMMTIREKKGGFTGRRLAYVGDGNNVANSLIEITSILGMEMTMGCPAGLEPAPAILSAMRERTKRRVEVFNDPVEAVKGADVIYTDVWVSMSEKGDSKAKKARFKGFQINSSLVGHAKDDVIVLHCLPAHRGEEITDSVMDGVHSAVFDQAENRLYSQMALLAMLIP